MMQVTIVDKSPSEIMDIVKDLRNTGWVQGTDFDFAYYQSKHEYMSNEDPIPATTVFTFYKEKYATFFSLKYGFK